MSSFLFAKTSRKWWVLLALALLVAWAVWYVRPGNVKPFRLGLDLKGGTHLVYQADTSAIPEDNVRSAMEGVRDVIERRVNALGVAEPIVQLTDTDGEYRLIIELAGVYDTDAAIEAIGKTPVLEFREAREESPALTKEQQQQLDAMNKDAKARAQELLAQAKALPSEGREEAFAAIAREHSDDPGSAPSGGDLGFFRREVMVGPFADAVFDDLAVGEITAKLVESEFGWHIILKTGEREVDAAQSSVGVSNITAIGENGQPVEIGVSTTPEGAQPAEKVKEAKASHILIRTFHPREILGLDADWARTELSGAHLKSAYLAFDSTSGAPMVSLEFNDEGAKFLEDISERNVDKPLGIFIDGMSPVDENGDGVINALDIYAPTIQQKLTGGSAVITGNMTVDRAKALASNLQAGALPVPITILAQTTVGPTLGQASVEASIRAALLGFALVALFMIAYYRLPGLASVIALAAYGVFTLAALKAIGATITLAGIAGFVMSIGMAVDANVLVLERLKEELRSGRTLLDAIGVAFSRAWSAIRDANVATLISAFILATFSSSVVKGFAITLAMGVIVSMFSAVVVTRALMVVLAGKGTQHLAWYGVRRVEKTV
ncbi:MAG: protein translocase subunit SecD [bacterium]|nr:protein translocase subunit SecD [bacterium]